MTEEQYDLLRRYMVEVIDAHAHLAGADIGKDELDERVMGVMAEVPRHEFVPAEIRAYAYADGPLPIGHEKTVSQPFMVALMTDLLTLEPEDVVLEVGTGLGYHAAVMSHLVSKVYSVEIIEELATQASRNLRESGCANVETRIGDGSRGWADHAPFDKILVAAAPELISPLLLAQIKPGGRMVIPAGIPGQQQLMLVEKGENGRTATREVLSVVFSSLETPS